MDTTICVCVGGSIIEDEVRQVLNTVETNKTSEIDSDGDSL